MLLPIPIGKTEFLHTSRKFYFPTSHAIFFQKFWSLSYFINYKLRNLALCEFFLLQSYTLGTRIFAHLQKIVLSRQPSNFFQKCRDSTLCGFFLAVRMFFFHAAWNLEKLAKCFSVAIKKIETWERCVAGSCRGKSNKRSTSGTQTAAKCNSHSTWLNI